VRIRYGDDADFEDGGVRRELRFEGDGGYVFAACALSDPHFTYLCVYDSMEIMGDEQGIVLPEIMISFARSRI
jgi:hypothetical protein